MKIFVINQNIKENMKNKEKNIIYSRVTFVSKYFYKFILVSHQLILSNQFKQLTIEFR